MVFRVEFSKEAFGEFERACFLRLLSCGELSIGFGRKGLDDVVDRLTPAVAVCVCLNLPLPTHA